VTDCIHITTLNLIGICSLTSFHSAGDGAGGTIITNPPVSSGTGVAPPH
jgi:hypothetical protein